MGKSTLVLVLLAALGLGSLIGVSLVEDEEATPAEDGVVAVTSTGGAPVYRFLGVGDVTVEYDDFGQAKPYTVGENFISREAVMKSETLNVALAADEEIEYKVIMQQGDSISFRWVTDGGTAYYDFHGHDPAFGPGFWTRYEEGETAELSGSIVAPYSGQHGWYWINLEGKPMTITLEVAGFYDEIAKIDLGGD